MHVKVSAARVGGFLVSIILQRLRQGYEPGHLFDRQSLVAYVLTALALVVGSILFFGSGFSFASGIAVAPPLWVAMALVAAWLSRRARHTRLATGLETTAIVYGQGLAFLLVIYALMALPVPLVDQQLAAADRALGFYWPDLAAPFRRNYLLTEWSKAVYRSFTWQPALVTCILAASGLHTRAWQFVTAATISLCIAAFVGPMFPADTAVVYFHVAPWPELKSAWRASEVIHAIRSGHRLLDQSMITGLLTMPSYHATAAALFTWALFAVRTLRWPVTMLNGAMFVLTVVIGGHYTVDLFGGLAVAAVSIALGRRAVPDTRPATL
jgi:hypothetical protein